MTSSRIEGFAKLSVEQRRQKLAELTGLSDETLAHLARTSESDIELANRLSENVVSTMNLPLGLATNLIVDGAEPLVPMATEESSVIAAVCNAAKRCRSSGGFITSFSGPIMIAQVQLVDAPDPEHCRLKILERRQEIQQICDETDPVLVKHGGGFRDLEVRILDSRQSPMVITHLLIDTRDAMGANAVNSMAEALAPHIRQWTGARTYLRILSNLADRRLARARAVWPLDEIGGAEVRDGMLSAYAFADADPYRAATHNKGIMNGVTAVALATGQDTRAVESGAHAFAARGGRYRSLTRWERDGDGNLVGSIELPMPVGLIGGATKLHPTAQAALEIMGVRSAEHLARLIAAVGLAQNFAALRVLATTGVQQGHMSLHAQNIALMAGAKGDEVDRVAERLRERGTVRVDVAEEVLQELRGGG
jgi:hydroxymethylglutaryl-CoA reductase